MAERFESYADEHYLPALRSSDADVHILLAGLRYVETRGIEGHETPLREICTSRYEGSIGRDIDAACVDALIATTTDSVATARFLALVATMDRPLSSSKVCEEGLVKLGPSANEALLRELAGSHKPTRLRKLARILARTSKVRAPQPPGFWARADETQRAEAAERWRARIGAAGRLPTNNGDNPDHK